MKESNDRLSAMQMVKRLALGCRMYAEENDGMLPSTMTDLRPYVVEPYDPEAYVLVASGKLREIEEIEDSSRAFLIRQKEPLPDGQQAVAFVDGHAEIVPMK